jgi:hypothetical protein
VVVGDGGAGVGDGGAGVDVVVEVGGAAVVVVDVVVEVGGRVGGSTEMAVVPETVLSPS